MKINNKQNLYLYIGIIIACVIFLNIISRNWLFKRIDLTDNQMYSLSSSSKNIIKELDDIFTIKIYFSNDLPGEYGNNKRYLQDILEEYVSFSNGNIKFEFYETDNDEDLQEEARKSGIQPVQLQVLENDKVEVKQVYMGMSFIFEDKRDVIPVIQTTTGLEYDITTRIKKLASEKNQNIGILNINNQAPIQNLTQQLRENFIVRNISLDNPIPENIDLVILPGVIDSLSESQMGFIDGYYKSGGDFLIAQNRILTDLQTQQANPINSNIFDFINKVGINIEENLVLDQVCGKVNVQQNMGIFRMAVPMDYPFIPIIQKFHDIPIVKDLEQLSLIFPSEITIQDSISNDNLVVSPLFVTSNNSTTMTGFYNLAPDPKQNPIFSQLTESGKTVGSLSQHKWDDTSSSSVIVVSDSKFLTDDGGGASPENMIFIQNAIDYLFGDDGLIALRSREITSRPLQIVSDNARTTWKWANIVIPFILIIMLGFYKFTVERKRSRFLKAIYDKSD